MLTLRACFCVVSALRHGVAVAVFHGYNSDADGVNYRHCSPTGRGSST